MTTLIEKARRSVGISSQKPDDTDPIAELRRLHTRYTQIEAATERLLAALKSVHERERTSYRAFCSACEDGNQEAIDRALNNWLSVAPGNEFAAREYAAATSLRNFGSTFAKLKAEFPGAKAALLRACALRLAEAEKQAARILTEETRRLGTEGFSPNEIEASARVKRANARVRNLQTAKRRIEAEQIENTWRVFAPQLLNHEARARM